MTEPEKPARSPQGKLCPICSRSSVTAYAPFCSARCADVDLNRWLGGVYAIPVDPSADEADPGVSDDDER